MPVLATVQVIGGVPRAPRSTRARRVLLVALGAAAFAGIVFFQIPICPTATFLGIPCPGCGLTRATLELAHGHLGAAVALHPLAPVISPLFAWLTAKAAVDYVRGPQARSDDDTRRARWTTRIGAALLIALLSVWVVRFFGVFGGPVPVQSPGRDLAERALEQLRR
jgi:hypothetical protein